GSSGRNRLSEHGPVELTRVHLLGEDRRAPVVDLDHRVPPGRQEGDVRREEGRPDCPPQERELPRGPPARPSPRRQGREAPSPRLPFQSRSRSSTPMLGSQGSTSYWAQPAFVKGSASRTASRAATSGTRRSSAPPLRGSSGPEARRRPLAL